MDGVVWSLKYSHYVPIGADLYFICLPQSFHSEYALKNYPLRERTEKEMEDLHRVQNIRSFEMAVSFIYPLIRGKCG